MHKFLTPKEEGKFNLSMLLFKGQLYFLNKSVLYVGRDTKYTCIYHLSLNLIFARE